MNDEKLQIQLPFKPFRTDEILAIANIPFAVYDRWLSMRVADAPLLPLQTGEDTDHTVGLNYFQVFAVFVGGRFLHEDAPRSRAEAMVRAVQYMNEDYLRFNFDNNDTFYDVNMGIMVPAPGSPLGQRLNLRRLYAEFQSNVKKVFPEG